MKKAKTGRTNRRGFIATVGTALSGAVAQVHAHARETDGDLDAWFDRMSGKHRMVFDAISVNDGIAIVWAYTFLESHKRRGVEENDVSVMVVLRSKAIALAFDDRVWKKYKFGKFFKVVDWQANANAESNIYWDTAAGLLPEKGMSMQRLQERGVMFCVCETAMNLNSKQLALSSGRDVDETRKDWLAGLLPNIQVVPSGVWALNMAQERRASYCAAG